MTIANPELVRQLLEWLEPGARPYPEVMRAWRTSCPRLSIWEDALDARLVCLERAQGDGALLVRVTPEGSAFLDARDAAGAACREERRGVLTSGPGRPYPVRAFAP